MIDDQEAGAILTEMVQIGRTFRRAGQRSPDQNATGTRLGFLKNLSREDARLGELAHHMVVSAPVATRTVESLEADGLVERRCDPADARAVLISITDLGRESLGQSERDAVGRFARALDEWTSADVAQAISILSTLNVHLSEVLEHPHSAEPAETSTATTLERGSEMNG